MGCLMEIICEVFLEVFLEAILYCYKKIVHMIVPEHSVTPKAARRIESIIKLTSVILALVMIAGVFLLFREEPHIRLAGILMTLIPLGVFVLILCSGLIARSIKKRKR